MGGAGSVSSPDELTNADGSSSRRREVLWTCSPTQQPPPKRVEAPARELSSSMAALPMMRSVEKWLNESASMWTVPAALNGAGRGGGGN